MRSGYKFAGFFAVLGVVLSCHHQEELPEEQLFTKMEPDVTGIGFINQVEYTEEYNTYTYRNFYNGAGVAIGDVNNDGLPDLYFCGNLENNKLYLNRGGFRFEDITDEAGVACPGVWSTGVSMADVNGDGWMDIYVCKSGDPETEHRSNELFINNGDLTFTERAKEYGIDDLGLSTHAAFFDYDRDGDLDCYLLNNSFQSVTEFDATPGQREIRDTLGGNKLYINEGGHFADGSGQAGIYGSKIGFGLGVSTSDINRDGWADLYVSNDFFERDYLYLNNGDGTFRECLEEQVREISLGAMGADIADLTNDGFPEVFVTEMTAEDEKRLKTKVLFESWEIYCRKLESGYYHQFARNVLQLNNRDGTFSEIGRYSGVDATDWSWGALILDMDNDGWKDIFVANGIYKDLLDRDYLNLYSDPAIMRTMIAREEQAILGMIDRIPSQRIPNYAFHNKGDLRFDNRSRRWGLATPSHSNGAAYGDLDNDGDLDLVVNNVNMPPFVYRNESDRRTGSNFLVVELEGSGLNTEAIGASVTIYFKNTLQYQELFPMRGFKSTVDNRLHFGLGSVDKVDSLIVRWPGGSCTGLFDVEANQFIALSDDHMDVPCAGRPEPGEHTLFAAIDPARINTHRHVENDFSDFSRDPLLFHMISNEGPHLGVADVNSDGRDDLYICGARGQPGAMFLQGRKGRFTSVNQAIFRNDSISEDTDCAFFDADGDGDMDLYVTSGGNELPSSSSALKDRLYFNNGSGVFSKSAQVLPGSRYESTSCVEPADFDGDGDIDLFVGTRLRPFLYGIPVSGYLLKNDGSGLFTNVTKEMAPGLSGIGMITDMVWADVDGDQDPDMVVVGDWMPVVLFINEKGRFSNRSSDFGLDGTEGWWHAVHSVDLNSDGYPDLVLGNHGLNSRFSATGQKQITMHVNDFDLNGSVEQIINCYNGEHAYPMAMKNDLVGQIPGLGEKYPNFADYAGQALSEIFSEETLQRSVVKRARILESCVMHNMKGHSFLVEVLPAEAQFAPIYAICTPDVDQDGIPEIVLGGNQHLAKPETGIYASSYGVVLKAGPGGAYTALPSTASGISVKGQIRDMEIMNLNGNRAMVIARNNDILALYSF